MFQFSMSPPQTREPVAGPAPPTVRGEPAKDAKLIDVAGMIRQASTQVKVDELVRSGKRNIHLLSREKIGDIINRSIRNIVEKHRAAGTLADPATLARMGEESKREFDDLLSQHQQTAKAGEDLEQSRLALDAELKNMRDDIVQQRALADGRLPAEVERAMAEKRFEKLSAHLAEMDRALGVLFSSKLYTYRQIQTLLRQATAARKAAERKARMRSPVPAAPAKAPAPVARQAPAGVVAAGGRRIEAFNTMDLESGRGLDVGTVNICAAARRRGSAETVYNIQRNAFIDVRDDAFSRKLPKYGIDYIVRGERGYVIGDAAFEFANIFDKSIRRPMKEGLVCADEPDALLIINHLVEELLGPPQEPGEICTFSVPGDPVDDGRNFIYQRSALEAALVTLGYTPRPMLESHLVVLAELKGQDYTGIGLSCGGGRVNVCVAYKSVPTLAFSTPRGGDWIDASVAAALGLPVPLVCAIKEGGMDLMNPRGRVQEAVTIYHRHFIQYTLESMKRRMQEAQDRPTFAKPVPFVLAGGTAMIRGFVELFRGEFEQIDFPVEVEEIRLAANPLKVVAGGCLQAALAETRALNEGPVDVAPAALQRAAVSGIPKADPSAALHLARLQSAVSGATGATFGDLERSHGWGRVPPESK